MTAAAGPEASVPRDIPGLEALWRDLLRFALRRGVPWASAEDLVGETVLKALERFDGARGEFAPFCRAILANLAKNWHRDRKPHDPLDDQPLPAPDDPAADAAQREVLALMRQLTAQIMAELAPDEAAFLLALGQALEEAESRAVAHAARSLGLSALKGWDLLRRIQRKAARHEARFQLLAEAPTPAAMIMKTPVDEPLAVPDDWRETSLAEPGQVLGSPAGADARWSAARRTLSDIARDAARAAAGGLARFAGGLPPHARDRLSALLG